MTQAGEQTKQESFIPKVGTAQMGISGEVSNSKKESRANLAHAWE